MFAHRLRFDSLPLLPLRLFSSSLSHLLSAPVSLVLATTRRPSSSNSVAIPPFVPFLRGTVSSPYNLPLLLLTLFHPRVVPTRTITEFDDYRSRTLSCPRKRRKLALFARDAAGTGFFRHSFVDDVTLSRRRRRRRRRGWFPRDCPGKQIETDQRVRASIFLRPRMCMIGKRTSTEGWYASCTPKTRE